MSTVPWRQAIGSQERIYPRFERHEAAGKAWESARPLRGLHIAGRHRLTNTRRPSSRSQLSSWQGINQMVEEF